MDQCIISLESGRVVQAYTTVSPDEILVNGKQKRSLAFDRMSFEEVLSEMSPSWSFSWRNQAYHLNGNIYTPVVSTPTEKYEFEGLYVLYREFNISWHHRLMLLSMVGQVTRYLAERPETSEEEFLIFIWEVLNSWTEINPYNIDETYAGDVEDTIETIRAAITRLNRERPDLYALELSPPRVKVPKSVLEELSPVTKTVIDNEDGTGSTTFEI